MIALADFSPFILHYADGCPEFVIQDAVRDTIQDFYRQTKMKEVEPAAIDVVADTGVYTLTVTDFHVFEISAAIYDGRELSDKLDDGWRTQTGSPKSFFMPALDQVRLVPTPELSLTGGLKVACLVYPAREVTSFDEILIEEHRDAIIAGVLGRILTQQDRPWTNPKLGFAFAIAYQEAATKAAAHVRRARGRGATRVKGHYF